MGAIGMVISVIVFGSNQKRVRHADRIAEERCVRAADAAAKEPNAVAVTEDLPPVLNEEARNMAAVPEWKRIVALIVIFLIVIVFWMVFHQN